MNRETPRPMRGREDRMLDWDWLSLPAEVQAVRAELLLRGVSALAERDGTLLVTAASEELAEQAVEELLGDDVDVRWLGPTNHRIVPARVLSYEYFPVNTIYLTVEAREDERVDCAHVAEDDEKVVVAAFKCSPHVCRRGMDEPGLERVLLDGALDGRPVIDALTGQVLPEVRQPLDV